MNKPERPVLSLDELNDPTAAPPNTEPQKGKQLMEPGIVASAIEELSRQKLDPISKEYRLNQLKLQSGYPMGALREMLDQHNTGVECEQAKQVDVESCFTELQKQAAARLAQHKNLFEIFPMTLDLVDYVTSTTRARCMLLVLGLTLIRKVIYICFYGDTSDGKTEAAERLLSFIDQDGVLQIVKSRLEVSQNWLKYAGGDDGLRLHKKLLFLDETNPVKKGDDDTKQSLMRQFGSENSEWAEYEITDKDAAGRPGPRTLRLKKPTQFLITSITAPHDWDAQNRNRYVFLEFSHTPETVEEVLSRIATPWSDADTRSQIYKSWNYFLLKYAGKFDPNDPLAFSQVEVPFLKTLVRSDKTNRGADIRRFKLLEKFIQASALLHANQREKKADKHGQPRVLVAAWQDYYNIKALFEEMVPRVTQPGGKAYLETFRKIAWALYNDSPQHRYALQTACNLPDKATEEHPKALVKVGLLESEQKANDQKTYYKLGARFMTELGAVLEKAGIDRAEQVLFDHVVTTVIEEIESINEVGPASSLAPSTSLTDPARDLKGQPVEGLAQVPCSNSILNNEKKYSIREVLNSKSA